MDEINVGTILKQCVTGLTIAFIFGSLLVFDATLKDFQREARIRDKKLAVLKHKCNKQDEELSLLEGKNKELHLLLKKYDEELSLIKEKNKEYYLGECLWSAFVNRYDETFTYAPEGYVITGVSNRHHNFHEDRRFDFKVCKLLGR